MSVGPALFQQSGLDAELLRKVPDASVKLTSDVVEDIASDMART